MPRSVTGASTRPAPPAGTQLRSDRSNRAAEVSTVFYTVTNDEPKGRYRVWLRFEDGLEGEVDLSGRGVFEAWLEPGVFEQVFVDEEADRRRLG